MNRVVAFIAVVLVFAGAAYSQSLGEVARHNRQAKQANKKSAAHVYTNDDIPSVTVIRETSQSPTPQSPAAAAEPVPPTGETKAEGQPAEGDSKAAEAAKKIESAADATKAADVQRARIEEQRKAVELLEREVNVAQREHQIQTAVFYTDAGSRLRDPKDWTEKQKKYEDEMAAKSKTLEQAKQRLQDLEDEARRSSTTTATP
jgi:hypothetical protein